ncbi:UK114 [Carabus blaptoides fortunei]
MSIIRKLITTSKAPKPVAPYNQAVLVDRTLYVSGVIGLDKNTMRLVDGGITAQTRQTLQNLGHILEAGGSSFDRVIKTTILLQNMSDFSTVNCIYEEFFTKDYPARCAYQVAALPLGAQVEIEAIAISGPVTTVIGSVDNAAGCGTGGPISCKSKIFYTIFF